jgi:hypothetical protein
MEHFQNSAICSSFDDVNAKRGVASFADKNIVKIGITLCYACL